MDVLLDIRGLTKRFGPITAVDGVTFTVRRGEVLGFLGPNGAGKSTTMKMVTGFLPPSAGQASVCGFDVVAQPIEVKRRIGYLPEGAPAYGDMTPHAILHFAAAVRGLDGAARARAVDAVVARLALDPVLHQPIETLSKGFKRRVGLALAILHDPKVLILDEPTDGLDPNQKHQVRTLLRDMAADKAIVVSTHILEEVDAVCTRAIVIAGGRLIADAAPDELRARSPRHNAVEIRLPAAAATAAKRVIAGLNVVARVEALEAGDEAARGTTDGLVRLRAYPVDGAEILTAVHGAVRADGIEVAEIFIERGRLDDVFRALTMPGAATAQPDGPPATSQAARGG